MSHARDVHALGIAAAAQNASVGSWQDPWEPVEVEDVSRRTEGTKNHQQPDARYGVDIRGETIHAESDELGRVLDLLDGQSGTVRIFDRKQKTVVYEGAVDMVRRTLGEVAGRPTGT